MTVESYDVIIIGAGTLAHRLVTTGKKILILERQGFLPREKANWNAKEIYQKERYHTNETLIIIASALRVGDHLEERLA